MPNWTILVLLASLTGCAGSAPVENNSATNSTALPEPAVRLALLPPSREGDAALATGVLAVDGPCLYLVGPDGSRRLPGFMTFDTRWEKGTLVVGTQRFVPGQRVALGGGEVKGAVANMAWVQAPDPSCDSSLIWVTVSIAPA